tara:strand:- start:213 stop:602 length:390 start_codon:yes stop_codon:yes gene_type:complete
MSTMIRTVQSVTMSGNNSTAAAAMAWPYDNPGVLQSARILSNTTVAGHASNIITISATQNSTTIFSRSTATSAGGTLAAGDSELQTLGTTMVGDKLELEKGEEVTFAVAVGGTGPAYELSVELVYKLVN